MSQNNIQTLIGDSCAILGIMKPIRVQFHTHPKGLESANNKNIADSDVIRSKRGQRGDTDRISNVKPILHHRINVYLFNLREWDNVDAIIVHELIHCFQWENVEKFNKSTYGIMYHGPEFVECAKYLGKHFGIPHKKIYRPDTDNY